MRQYLVSHFRSFVLLLGVTALFSTCSERPGRTDFSFVFMTDIHLTWDSHAKDGFLAAINTINTLHPDFVITGGDMIMDALGQRYSRADSLYGLYSETVQNLRMPVYNTMGNHEIYGIYRSSGADSLGPEYGERMFEKRLGKSYYSFGHKGWKFFILNSVEDTGKSRYIGKIDSSQIAWLANELKMTDKNTPLVISTHVPFITATTQKYAGTTVSNDSASVIYNGKEVLDLFRGYNLKLVLQGHLHTVEDISIDGIRFITGGAVSGAWWTGPNKNYEEGFVLVSVRKNDFSWKYVDYGWNAVK